MDIKVYDYGYSKLPERSHDLDVGADVRICFHDREKLRLHKGETIKIPLGLGIELPEGYMGLIYPRSGLSSKGITCQLPPIDPGYTGEIHAIVSNVGNDDYYMLENGDKIGQLVIMPIVYANFIPTKDIPETERGNNGFGSTGK